MPIDFYSFLDNPDGTQSDMPVVTISERPTDKRVVYNSTKIRLDYIAGNIYGDETLWRLILWANPEYELEYDIPDNTVLRIPFPKQDVINEVKLQLINNNRY